jgi:hypothetical protein
MSSSLTESGLLRSGADAFMSSLKSSSESSKSSNDLDFLFHFNTTEKKVNFKVNHDAMLVFLVQQSTNLRHKDGLSDNGIFKGTESTDDAEFSLGLTSSTKRRLYISALMPFIKSHKLASVALKSPRLMPSMNLNCEMF